MRSILTILMVLLAAPAWGLGLLQGEAENQSTGRAMPGISVYIYWPGTTTSVTLYSDANGVTQIANPMTTDIGGEWECYVEAGLYDAFYSHSTITDYTDSDLVVQDVRSSKTPLLSVSAFGAVPGDGVDDTAAFAEACDSATVGGSVVKPAPGTYEIDDDGLDIHSAKLDLRGVTINWTPTAHYQSCFYSSGTAEKIATLTDYVRSESTDPDTDTLQDVFDVPGAQLFEVGDLLALIADQQWPENTYRYSKTSIGWMGKVRMVTSEASSYEYALTDGCLVPMDATVNDGIGVYEITPTSPQIIGGTIVVGGPADYYANPVEFNLTEGALVSGTHFIGTAMEADQYSSMIRIANSYATRVRDCYVDLSANQTYGAVVAGLVYNCSISGMVQTGGRSVVTTSFANFPLDDVESADSVVEAAGGFYRVCGVGFLGVSDSQGSGMRQTGSAFSCHPTGRWLTFDNCKALNCRSGFYTRSSYTTFQNCEYAGLSTSDSAPTRQAFSFNDANSIDGASSLGHPTQTMIDLYGQSGTVAQLLDSDNNVPGAEGSHWGGQRPLVGNRLVNCRITGANRPIVIQSNGSLDAHGVDIYDDYTHNFTTESVVWARYQTPKFWDAGLTYTEGDWVRDYDGTNYYLYRAIVSSGPHSDYGSYVKPIDDAGWIEDGGSEGTGTYWKQAVHWASAVADSSTSGYPEPIYGKIYIDGLTFHQMGNAPSYDTVLLHDYLGAPDSTEVMYERVTIKNSDLGYPEGTNAGIKVEAWNMRFSNLRMGYPTARPTGLASGALYDWWSAPSDSGIVVANDSKVHIGGVERTALLSVNDLDIAAGAYGELYDESRLSFNTSHVRMQQQISGRSYLASGLMLRSGSNNDDRVDIFASESRPDSTLYEDGTIWIYTVGGSGVEGLHVLEDGTWVGPK